MTGASTCRHTAKGTSKADDARFARTFRHTGDKVQQGGPREGVEALWVKMTKKKKKLPMKIKHLSELNLK